MCEIHNDSPSIKEEEVHRKLYVIVSLQLALGSGYNIHCKVCHTLLMGHTVITFDLYIININVRCHSDPLHI